MNRFLGLSIFLSLVLFSCSKSTEDKLVGSWFDENRGVMITMNSDKTVQGQLTSFTSLVGIWSFIEEEMIVCFSENVIENVIDCFTIFSIDENELCLFDSIGNTSCFNKVK